MRKMRLLTGRAKGAAAALLAVCTLASATASAGEAVPKCASLEEAAAFSLRHLQSRLMVAALSCNQQAAYNTFVEHFRTPLVGAGGMITEYYRRVGGGQTALNRHITDLANAAGLSRAEDPDGYCKQSWDLFWHLEQDATLLTRIADENVLVAITSPTSCSVTVASPLSGSPQNVTATFDASKAAAENNRQ